jgi:ATP-dependent Lon protease
MEIIFLSGYTEGEKCAIAIQYLIPRQIRENGLHPDEVTFTDEGIRTVIRSYTREAGVRNLEREIGSICRKVVVTIAEAKAQHVEITAEKVRQYLGRPKYFGNEEIAQRTSIPGVATGLAYTPAGGDVLFIEATRMPGGKGFQITGSLGNVMQESAKAALSFVRSRAQNLNLEDDF